MYVNIILKSEGVFSLTWSFSGQTDMSQVLLGSSVFFQGMYSSRQIFKWKLRFYPSDSLSRQQRGLQREDVGNSVSRNSGCLFLHSVRYHRGPLLPQCLGLQTWNFAYDNIRAKHGRIHHQLSSLFCLPSWEQTEGPKSQDSLLHCPDSPQGCITNTSPPALPATPAPFSHSTSNTQHFYPASQYLRITEKCLFHSLDMETWP